MHSASSSVEGAVFKDVENPLILRVVALLFYGAVSMMTLKVLYYKESAKNSRLIVVNLYSRKLCVFEG